MRALPPAGLSALLAGEWDAVAVSSPAVARQASGIAAAHLQWHLERDLRSLPHVDRGDHAAHRTETPGARTAQIS